MRALVVSAPDEIAIRELRAPRPGRGQVLIRSRAVGLCRTDLEILRGELEPGWVEYPCVPGHEWSGVVERTGDGVDDLRVGQAVVCEGIQPCLHCPRCLAGDTNLCETYSQLGYTRSGGGAELVVVARGFVHPLSATVDPEVAVLTEPAASAVRMLRRARLRVGETVGVIGVGALGAMAILLARLAGAAAVLAFGKREAELELASRLGASEAIDVLATQREPQLDVVIETAGAADAVELATRVARRGGRVGLLGLAGRGRMLELPSDRFANRDLEVVGGASYDRAAWAQTVELINSGRVDPSLALGARHPLADHAAAYRDLEGGRAVGRTLLLHA